jgi:hypothetical protein
MATSETEKTGDQPSRTERAMSFCDNLTSRVAKCKISSYVFKRGGVLEG